MSMYMHLSSANQKQCIHLYDKANHIILILVSIFAKWHKYTSIYILYLKYVDET